MNTMNRETWLNALADKMAPTFAELGHPLPAFRVSVGFTSAGMSNKVAGECWNKSTTADEHFTILISPIIADSMDVAAVLNHELIHAAVGLREGHAGKFATAMKATGMERPFTASKHGAAFRAWVAPFIAELGDIPHSPLAVRHSVTRERIVKRAPGGVTLAQAPAEAAPESSRPPKQSTRMLKACCTECGYTVRVTAKWLEVGPPHCPAHGAMQAEA